jgi:uncharacterized iron-regulated membrane protein
MKRKIHAIFKRWHRRMGIVSAGFVIVLSVTGLILLFGAPLGLDRVRWGGPVIARLYHLAPKTPPVGIKLSDRDWVIMVDGLVYIKDAPPLTLDPPLAQARRDSQFFYIANTSQTLVTLHDGTLVERLNRVDFEGLTPTPLPGAQKAEVLRRYSGRGLPLSRVLLDLHTGRVFGKIGVWLMALASIFLLALSLSGLVMWFKKPNGKRTKN